MAIYFDGVANPSSFGIKRFFKSGPLQSIAGYALRINVYDIFKPESYVYDFTHVPDKE